MTDRSSRLRVLINAPRWHVRRTNTDWLYNFWLTELDRLTAVDTRVLSSVSDILATNANWALTKLGLPRSPTGKVRWRRGDADVVFNHREFPSGSPVPVVWQHCILDPAMMAAAGIDERALDRQFEAIAPFAREAARIQIVNVSAIPRHTEKLGVAPDRFSECPMFLPHLRIASRDAVRAKQVDDAGRVRFLIVGHQARRKGLDLLLANLARLPAASRQRVRLDVVGALSDIARWDLVAPSDVELRYHRTLPRAQTMALFERAHVYCMPSRFESVGLSFIEAMGAGCAVIACHWEGQRDILDGGAAGWLVDPFGDFTAVLTEVLDDRDRRLDMALKARDRAAACYAPEVVAAAYLEMFQTAARMGPGPGGRP